MELISSTGTSLTLTIEAYQFPEILGEGDDDDITADSNWRHPWPGARFH